MTTAASPAEDEAPAAELRHTDDLSVDGAMGIVPELGAAVGRALAAPTAPPTDGRMAR
jgi:hypothetical protein